MASRMFNINHKHNAIQKRKVHAVVPGGLCISAAVLCIVFMHAWASVLGLGKAGCSNGVFMHKLCVRLMLDRCSSGCSAD